MRLLFRGSFLILFLFLLGGGVARGQAAQTISAAGADCTITQACAVYNVSPNAASAVITVAGNASGNTLQFEICSGAQPTPCAANGADWSSVNAFPPNSSTAVTSTTGAGQWSINVAGYTAVRVRCSAFVSGTAKVSANISNAVAAATLIGAGGGGLTVVATLPATCTPGGANGQVLLGGVVYTCTSTNTFSGPGTGFSITGAANVIADYDFHDCSGTTISDISGNSANGTINGGGSGTAVWTGTSPQCALVLTNTKDKVTLTAGGSMKGLEALYCYPDPGNLPSPATQDTNSLFTTATATGVELIFGNNAQRPGTIPALFQESALGGTNPSSIYQTSPIGCHTLIYDFNASTDATYLDGVLQTPNGVNGGSLGQFGAFTLLLGGSQGAAVISMGNGITIYRVRMLAIEPTAAVIQQEHSALASFLANTKSVALGNAAAEPTSPINSLRMLGDSNQTFTNLTIDEGHVLSLYGNWKISNNARPTFYTAGLAANPLSNIQVLANPGSGVNIFFWNDCANDFLANNSDPRDVFKSHMQAVRAVQQVGGISVIRTCPSSASAAFDVKRDILNTYLRNGQQTYNYIISDIGGTTTLGADAAGAEACMQGDLFHVTDACNRSTVGPLDSKAINRAAAMMARPSTSPNVYKVGATMTPQFVQAAAINQVGTGSLIQPVPSQKPVQPGDLLCEFIGLIQGTLNGVATDTQGNTFASVVFGNGGFSSSSSLQCAPNAVGGQDTITQAFTGAQNPTQDAYIIEIKGALAAAPLDVASAVTANTSNTAICPTVTTTVANDIVLCLVATTGDLAGFTPTTGWDSGTRWTPIVSTGNLFIQSQVVPTAGVVAAANVPLLSSSVTPAWWAVTVAFKPGVWPASSGMNDDEGVNIQNPKVLDPTGGAIRLALPEAQGETQQHRYIQVLGQSTNTVTLQSVTGSTETINGAGTSLALANNSSLDCISVLVSTAAGGNNWKCTAQSSSAPRTITINSAYTNATNGFTNLTDGTNNMAFPVAASTTYHMDCRLPYQAAATGGLNIEFTGPAGFTALVYSLDENTAAATKADSVAVAYSTSLGSVIVTATTNFPATVSFDLVNGATAGTVQLLAAASATVANGLTVAKGASCTMQQQ